MYVEKSIISENLNLATKKYNNIFSTFYFMLGFIQFVRDNPSPYETRVFQHQSSTHQSQIVCLPNNAEQLFYGFKL